MFVRTNCADARITSERYVSSVITTAHNERKTQAQRGLILFFTLLLSLSTLFYWLIIVKHDAFAMLFFMWIPGSAAIATHLLLREKFTVPSLPLSGRRLLQAAGIAVLTPLAIGLLAYGLAWKTGITALTNFHASANIASLLPFFGVNPSLLTLAGFVLLVACMEIISATGEELGWRGYMLTRLIDANVPQPVLVSGLIWSLWHWPFILLSSPANGLPQIVTAGIFLVTITSLGCISAQLRLSTGSLWPSILLHAAWNGIILEIFDALTKNVDASIWIGEPGLLVAGAALLAALIITPAGLYLRSSASAALLASKRIRPVPSISLHTCLLRWLVNWNLGGRFGEN
ncbi:MAG: hypothetical protein PVS3B1_23020 [Ktedonobacteraceae bacterium]